MKSDFALTSIKVEAGSDNSDNMGLNGTIASGWLIVNAAGLDCAWLLVSEAKLCRDTSAAIAVAKGMRNFFKGSSFGCA
jgi:hypothetical protein